MSNVRVPQNYTGGYTASDLINHMAQADMTLCVCAKIVSEVDGTVIGVTSLDVDLTSVPGYPGVTFKSTTGVTASKAEHGEGATANMEADLFLVTAGITEADLLAGKWTHADCVVFVTNYAALNMGQLVITSGNLGEFRQLGQMVTCEIKGVNNALAQQAGRVTRPECDAELGDARCGLDLSALGFIKTGTLTSVSSQTVFRDTGRTETGDYFQNGVFTFTSGPNNGLSFRIDYWDAATKEFTLRTPTPYLPVAGNTYSAKRGCRKRRTEDCFTKFNNVVNIRSFPDIPTVEDLTRLPLQ